MTKAAGRVALGQTVARICNFILKFKTFALPPARTESREKNSQ